MGVGRRRTQDRAHRSRPTGTRTIPLPTSDFPADWGGTDTPGGLVVADGSLWVAQGARFVRRIDPATGKVDDTITVLGAEHLAADRWRGLRRRSSGRYKDSTPRRTPSPGRQTAVQSEITSIAVAGGFVWLTTSADDGVIKLSADTGQPVGTEIPVSGGAERVVAGEGAVWVSNPRAGTVTRIDTSTNAKTTLRDRPCAVRASPPRRPAVGQPVAEPRRRAARRRDHRHDASRADLAARRRARRQRRPGHDLEPARATARIRHRGQALQLSRPKRRGRRHRRARGGGRHAHRFCRRPHRDHPRPVGLPLLAGTPTRRQHTRHRRDVPLHDRAQLLPQGSPEDGYLLLPQLVGGHAYATGKARPAHRSERQGRHAHPPLHQARARPAPDPGHTDLQRRAPRHATHRGSSTPPARPPAPTTSPNRSPRSSGR